MERQTPIDTLKLFATEGSETERKQKASEAVFKGLLFAYKNHKKLGYSGKLKDKENQFGEMALRADIEAEERVLVHLAGWAKKSGVFLEYRGEELGEDFTGSKGGERYLATIDGLDGSANYLEKTDFPYGTMVAVAKGQDPTYDDFEIAGIMLPEEGWIVLAIKNWGVCVYDIENKTTDVLPRFAKDYEELKLAEYDTEKILADDYFPEAEKLLGDKAGVWPRTGSTAATIVAMAIRDLIQEPIEDYSLMNDGWQALVDVTRKGNLEQPILFRIITELGGFMVDENGESIADMKFRQWGQDEKLPVITVQNEAILAGVMSELGLKRIKN